MYPQNVHTERPVDRTGDPLRRGPAEPVWLYRQCHSLQLI